MRAAGKCGRFSHHPLRVPKAWHRDFAACGQRSGLLALNLASIFEKLLDQKTFVCLRLVIGNIFLRETSRIRFGKARAHPQLALGIAIAPETLSFITTSQFKRQLRFFRFSLRFYLQIPVQFHLLRKCGLLAHTSPTFLKNCWIKKLFILPAARFLQPIQITKKKTADPFLRIGYLLLRMFVLHQKHREWTFWTISPMEAYFPGISPKISMAEKTFDTILFHSAKPLLTASHQSVLAFQFPPAVLGDSIP